MARRQRSKITRLSSVKVKLLQKPDLSKKGITKAVLEFSVDGIDKKSKAIVMVNVKTPAADTEDALPEVKVDSKVIETVLDEPGRPKWTQGVPIKPATVTSLDKDAEMVASIEGLPKGLSFDGTTITGTPVVDDDNWDGDGGMFKTVTMKFKAKKNGKLLVREYKYWIYRDKDHDGIADDDEDGGTAFTPQRVNAKPIDVDGTEPTLEDYKAKFSNIPADGSVKVKLLQKPDLSKKGMTKAVLEFSVDGIDKKSKAIVMVNVKTPVASGATSAVTSGTTSTRSAVTATISGNSSVETRDSGKANKREDIQKPAESRGTAENSAAAETERTVS